MGLTFENCFLCLSERPTMIINSVPAHSHSGEWSSISFCYVYSRRRMAGISLLRSALSSWLNSWATLHHSPPFTPLREYCRHRIDYLASVSLCRGAFRFSVPALRTLGQHGSLSLQTAGSFCRLSTRYLARLG